MIGLDDRKGHVAALLTLAKADGAISQHEVNLIKMISIRLRISSADFNHIVLNTESVNSLPPSSKEGREQYLYNLFMLMKIDLKTDPEEQQICEELGLRLGFGVSELKQAAEFMTSNFDQIITIDEFRAELNK
jgi:hypothetical protein